MFREVVFMPSIDISQLDYPELVALRDDVNRRILQIRRTPAMRLDELLLLFEETREALSNHGAIKGSYLTARRLLRCHPWHPGGYDPVP